MQADGKSGQDEIFKETNKVFDVGRGAIEMEVNKARDSVVVATLHTSMIQQPQWQQYQTGFCLSCICPLQS